MRQSHDFRPAYLKNAVDLQEWQTLTQYPQGRWAALPSTSWGTAPMAPWQALAGNFALVALFAFGWGHMHFWLRGLSRQRRDALFGLCMAAGAITSIMLGTEISPGVIIDLRAALLAVSAYFGGPVAALVSVALTSAWRISMGGAGMSAGLLIIFFSTVLGLAGRMAMGKRRIRGLHWLALSAAAALASGVLLLWLLNFMPDRVGMNLLLPVMVLNLLATSLAGLILFTAERIAAERDLLAAAISQVPHYAYVKNRDGEFVAVNQAFARLNGYESPAQMVGTDEASLAAADHPTLLLASDLPVMDQGEPVYCAEDMLGDSENTRWLSTSKTPLFGPDGALIGAVGIGWDITHERTMQADLVESGKVLSHALAEMSDGLAVFDHDGRMLFCNAQYQASFPLTGHMRKPGASYRDILEAVIASGEQKNVPTGDVAGWVNAIYDNLFNESETEIHLVDGRWLQVRTRPTSQGRTMVVVADVTRIKQTEVELQSATDRFRHLARTDGLTDLPNRRAFDAALNTEIARSMRTGAPLSLLLIDVDHFKAYNDYYGHPAGDVCLKQVSLHLRAALKRPADLPARYGGEEFAAILPDTDEDGAYLVAEGFRKAVAASRLPHKASERGILTLSVGVATYMPDNLRRSATDLLETADEALYSAKAAGRDRVYGRRVLAARQKYAQE